MTRWWVVYLLIPTSNHNCRGASSVCYGVVYLLIPTSNHNCFRWWHETSKVVYLLIPTSNHNVLVQMIFFLTLYIFWFLHQTTTEIVKKVSNNMLYIFWFLHQTTTSGIPSILYSMLYIFWFLHQTTTMVTFLFLHRGCISFDSYIKPQLLLTVIGVDCVVYLLIPTSNHN